MSSCVIFSSAAKSRATIAAKRLSSRLRSSLSFIASSSPYLPCDLHDALELAPLLVLAQPVAVVRARETALRGKTQVLERHELRGLIDFSLQLVWAFQRSGFRRHQTQYHLLALRHEAQRLEAAGARAVEFHEK